jgi:alpha-ketoglutarate-dependent taurine dioxygenase
MDSFRAHHADMADPAWQPSVEARLRDYGLVTFAGITDRAALITIARRLMAIRTHRDAAADGITEITEITDRDTTAAGYAAFTDAELTPHTDGSSMPDPPGLLLLTCVQPASAGGATLLADGAQIITTLAARHPAALRSLSAPRAARFGADGGYLGSVFEPAGPDRLRIRLRLDDLVRFSADAATAIPSLRTAISRDLKTVHLGPGDSILLCNTRWLHGRSPFNGHRTVLRILGDPLPAAGILPGFPAPQRASSAPRRTPGQWHLRNPRQADRLGEDND